MNIKEFPEEAIKQAMEAEIQKALKAGFTKEQAEYLATLKSYSYLWR